MERFNQAQAFFVQIQGQGPKSNPIITQVGSLRFPLFAEVQSANF